MNKILLFTEQELKKETRASVNKRFWETKMVGPYKFGGYQISTTYSVFFF